MIEHVGHNVCINDKFVEINYYFYLLYITIYIIIYIIYIFNIYNILLL